MTTATASAAIDTSADELDMDALQGALLAMPLSMQAMMIPPAMVAEIASGKPYVFGFSADDFGKRAFDADNAGNKPSVIGGAQSEEEEAEEQKRMDAYSDAMEQAHAAWLQQRHTLGGVEMTGAEIQRMSDMLNDPEFDAYNKERIMREKGWTSEQYEAAKDKWQRGAEITKTPEDQRTPEQKRDLDNINNDPDVGVFTRETKARINTYQRSLTANAEPAVVQTSSSFAGSQNDAMFDETPRTSFTSAAANTVSQSNQVEVATLDPANKAVAPSVRAG